MASIGLMLATLLVSGRHRAASVGILSALVATSALLATGYVDNARYVLGPLMVCVIGGVLGLRAGTHFARDSLLRPLFGTPLPDRGRRNDGGVSAPGES